MQRALFFGLLVACGGAPEPAHVEIAQPLPTVSVTASAAPLPAPPTFVSQDVGDPRPPPRRAASLLETEARTIESLVAATPASSSDLPPLLLRVAETYAELRKVAGDARASAKAIDHYTTLTAQFPSFAKIDDAYLGLGLEYVARGDLPNARRAFYELIKNVPQSHYVPYAYFAFGDMFEREARSDPSKWDFAQQAFVEVRKYPASPIAAEAVCRLSIVAAARGDQGRASSLRDELRRDYPSSHAAEQCQGP
ncbi:MAG TPA: tetratricopeptide repeat protein [Polyangiaceae bacterium]|jgi:outer membrane protein assembly factor BamD (BamD/ComL family)